MHRFFLNPEAIQGKRVFFPPKVLHQITRVLRMEKGDKLAVLDNSGMVYTVVLSSETTRENLVGEIIASKTVNCEPRVQVALFFGLTNREKVEWILQKGTEIGVSAFSPFVSARTLLNSTFYPEKRVKRWEQIIKEAAEQSGRGKLPVLNPPERLINCLHNLKPSQALHLLAWEKLTEDSANLDNILDGFSGNAITLFVGPEGGFSEDEVLTAQESGCLTVSLGARILRMETAAIVFPALVLHKLDAR